MADAGIETVPQPGGGTRLSLRTLLLLRWAALGGQALAVFVAGPILGMGFAVLAVWATIAAAVLANATVSLLMPGGRRLSGAEALAMLLFDVLQLALLLYLTGGLNNPFALLMLAPVTIAATLLSPRGAVAIGALAIALVSLLALFDLPLLGPDGVEVLLPALARLGFWLALVIGVAFTALYAGRVTAEIKAMDEALAATQLALSRAQTLTDLGAVVAAAAHELGTPLATITLTASELADELEDRPELREDAVLIRGQAMRCRDILRSMGSRDDLQMQSAPVEAILREAAEPHMARGIAVDLAVPEGPQPVMRRRPEILHGLRNLVQNAVDFAETGVEVELGWTRRLVTIEIRDDGPGFPAQLLPRIGDPFISSRRRPIEAPAPGEEGMGLGLFIAKALLERTGARLRFSNDAAGGAVVRVTWPRSGGPLLPDPEAGAPH
ncbi:ActS/PrrB/RegB family redox-sensitive histidine kinase [Pseudoroseicyclus aestuarii]|uniref:histidine kinase n=1 Tax=Pseudoroseicyclus aestuarii TaxID=1795041 RepID=A0A318T333_9RHOB|nr:ActS/PrrB/RegB family redox-sensitive histidine kinase [Pseudoroseicyclus aestuarii]PYE84624.1 two-component system sensor histidine kinase RegB [Pseudoroseicyclus aestuarii]